MTQLITYEDVASTLPPQLAKNISQNVLDQINVMLADTDMCEAYRNNIVNFQSAFKEGKFKPEQYVSAVRYVSHKMRGLLNKEAYYAAFPEKVLDWDTRSISEKDRSSYISMYHNSKLVTILMEQATMPMWVANQDYRNEALRTEAELMRNSKSDMVRHLAAAKILDITAKPESAKLEVDITTKDTSELSALRNQISDLVQAQKTVIEEKILTAGSVAEKRLVLEGEYEPVE